MRNLLSASPWESSPLDAPPTRKVQEDGLGSSRLLLTEQLEGLFPNGYRVALPERSRGFAFAAELDVEDADTVESLIQSSYWKGARPLSPRIFDPSDLLSATPRSTT